MRRFQHSNKARKKAASVGPANLESETAKVPLDQTRVEFDDDQIDETPSNVRDHTELKARRATQDKYE
jgi:hypothetical protein